MNKEGWFYRFNRSYAFEVINACSTAAWLNFIYLLFVVFSLILTKEFLRISFNPEIHFRTVGMAIVLWASSFVTTSFAIAKALDKVFIVRPWPVYVSGVMMGLLFCLAGTFAAVLYL